MAKETAEEKLLKMMQESAAATSGTAGASSATKIAPPKPKQFAFVFSIQMLNRVLILGILICVGLVGYEMYSGSNLLKTEIDFSEDAKTPASIAQIALPSEKDIKFYLNQISVRNIFRPYEGQVGKTTGEQDLAKRLSKFKLVGVAWLDLPETASIMIEDTEQKTTYFLRVGEQLEGVTVKTIYTDRVVFSYENEETTIKL